MTSALGCLAHLAALAALTFLVDRATGTSLPPELRPWVPLVTATFLTLGLSNIWTLARGYGQGDSSRRALLRAHAGQPPPQDGPILATGHVRAEGPPLVSPITGRPCVAYQYRVYERYLIANAQWETRVFYWGYACRPFRLDTASQAFRVLAMPRFVDAPTRFEDVPATRARTEAYVETWGLWSVDRRGIVPGALFSGVPGIAMVLGPPEDLLGRASGPPSSAMAVGVAGVVLLALGAALVWAARAGYVAQGWDVLASGVLVGA